MRRTTESAGAAVAPAFRALSASQTIGSRGHAHVAFFDSFSDKPDGGYVSCRQWDFRDGTGNPPHDYTATGRYTVTLTAVDDDGFASATSRQTVTITP